jgi:hypothetical protein
MEATTDFFSGLGEFEVDNYYKVKARYSNSSLKMAMPDHYDGNALKYKMYINNELPFKGNKATRIGTMVDDCLMKGQTINISDVAIPEGGLAEYVKDVFDEHVSDSYESNGHREDMLWNIESFEDLFISERANCTVWSKSTDEKFVAKIYATMTDYWNLLIKSVKEVFCSKSDFKEVLNCVKGFLYSPQNLSKLMGVDVEITDNKIIPHLIEEDDNYVYCRDVDVRILSKDCMYTDSKVGVSRKILIDFLRISKHDNSVLICDLKTGTGAGNYGSVIVNRKIDCQLAWYRSVLIDAVALGEFGHQPEKSINILESLNNLNEESTITVDCSVVILDKDIPLGLKYDISNSRIAEQEKYLYELVEKLETCYKNQKFVEPEWDKPLKVLSLQEWRESQESKNDVNLDLDFI